MCGFHLIFYNFANYFQQNHTMSFNSIEFLIFLPLVFLLYWFVFKSTKKQNLLIVAASYVFYGWWDWRFLILIAITSVCSYASGFSYATYSSYAAGSSYATRRVPTFGGNYIWFR